MSEERALRRRLEERIRRYEQGARSTHVARGLRSLVQPLALRAVAVVAVLLWTLAPDVSMAAAPPNTWNCSVNVAGCSYTTLAAMPTARYDLAAVTGPDGKVYAIGGYNGGGGFLNTVQAYTPGTNSWSCSASVAGCSNTSLASMPTTRYNLAAAAGSDGKIYAIGGLNGGAVSTMEA